MIVTAAGQWDEALRYFADPETRRQLQRLGLRVESMNPEAEEIEIGATDELSYLTALASITSFLSADSGTKCTPSPPVAVK